MADVPDFKTIADFRRDNAGAIQIACQRFVAICRALGLVGGGMVAIDGSRLRAVNTHEKNYTKGKLARRRAHVEESIARYLAELEQADSAETGPATPRIEHLTERLASLRGRLGELEAIGRQLEASPDGQLSLKLADKTLHERLSAEYEWATKAYEDTSAFVHLDGENIRSKLVHLNMGAFFNLSGLMPNVLSTPTSTSPIRSSSRCG